MADSCMEWILKALRQHDENQERDGDALRSRRTMLSSVSKTYRSLFKIRKPQRLVVRPWQAPTEKRPQAFEISSPKARNVLEDLKTALAPLDQRRKEIEGLSRRLCEEDVKLGDRLLGAFPLALSEHEDFMEALGARNKIAQALKAAQAECLIHQDKFRFVGKVVCRDDGNYVLTPKFDDLLRPLLRSMDSAADAPLKAEELAQQLKNLQHLAEMSKQLFMTSGKGWRVSPSKISSRMDELTKELNFLQQTETSRKEVLEKHSKSFFENKTTQAWLQSKKSVEALISAEGYQEAIDYLKMNRQRLDDYPFTPLKERALRSREELDKSYLHDLLAATNNVIFGEQCVGKEKAIALAAGASLMCVEDALDGAEYLTEIGYGVELPEDGRADSETPTFVQERKARFQFKVDGILRWQARLHRASGDAEIPASPASSVLSDASEYYRFHDWDIMDHPYDRQLVPWDSATNREYRPGIKKRIRAERKRQKSARSLIGPEYYGSDDDGYVRRYGYGYRDLDSDFSGTGFRRPSWGQDRSPNSPEGDGYERRRLPPRPSWLDSGGRLSQERDMDESLSGVMSPEGQALDDDAADVFPFDE